MNETLKAAGHIGAELGAAIAENERLRGLLEEAADHIRFNDLNRAGVELLARIKAALSQQAEPERCTCPSGDGSLRWPCPTHKPAPAQDERHSGPARYRVAPTGRGFWPFCVRAGDGTRELFVGHRKACERVAAELAVAFEDGKFVATRPAQTEQQPPHQYTIGPLTHERVFKAAGLTNLSDMQAVEAAKS